MIPHYLPLPFWQDKNLKFLWHKDPSWCTTVYYMFGLIYLLLCSNSTLLSVPWTHSVLSCLYLQCYFHYMECSYLFFFFLQKALLKGTSVYKFFPQFLPSHVTLSSISCCILYVFQLQWSYCIALVALHSTNKIYLQHARHFFKCRK